MKSTRVLTVLLAAAVAMPVTPAFAQLEEIVVTARKRDETLLEIPLTVSAFTAEEIQAAGYSSITDIVAAIPGVTYESFEAEGRGDSASFRGIATNTGDPTLQNSSKFIDGVYVSGSLFTTLLGDLERVEVIKGPQSALFGRATFSGAVNYITKKPTNEIEGNINISAAQQEENSISGSVSGPLIEDTLLFRISGGAHSQSSPYINATNGAAMGEQDIMATSGLLRFTPSDKFTADLMLMYSEAEFGEAARATTALNMGELAFPTDAVIGGNTDQLTTPGIDSETFRAHLTLNYEMDNGYDLMFIAGTGKEDTVNQADGNYDPNVVGFLSFLCNAGPFVGPGCDIFQTVTHREIESNFQEIRITSPDDGRFRWLAGISHFDEDFLTARLRNFRQPPSFKNSTNVSLFGSVSFDFTDKLTIGLDGRFQQEEIQLDVPEIGRSQKDDFDSFLPRLIVEYDLNDDTLLYFSAAQGNTPGNFNASAPPDSLTVEEQELWSYEFGTKLTTWDGRLNLQVAGYFMDWQDQVFRFNDPDPAFGSYFRNSGETDVIGIDFALAANFTDNLSGSLAYSWVDAEYQVFESNTALTVLGNSSVAGNATPRTADNSLFASLQYSAPLAALGSEGEWFLRADVSHRGEMFIDELNLETIGSRTLVNLRGGIDTGPVRLTVFIDNATDEDALTTGFRFGAVALVGLPMPRQVGVSASLNF